MTKYHLFGSSEYDPLSVRSQYIGVFDSPVDAYKGLEGSGVDYGELAVITDSGELKFIGDASVRYPVNARRTDTSVTWEYGWEIEGNPVIVKTEVEYYKATRAEIEAAASEFAEEHQVQFLGIDEYTHNRKFYIVVRFDWSPKYNIDWSKRERVERKASYQWEFDDKARTTATAHELISRTAGEQLKEDNMGHGEFTKYAQSVTLATGMFPGGFGVMPIGGNFD